MSEQHLLTEENRQLILIAAHGLSIFGRYDLARALLQMSLKWLTADELIKLLEEAKFASKSTSCSIPF